MPHLSLVAKADIVRRYCNSEPVNRLACEFGVWSSTIYSATKAAGVARPRGAASRKYTLDAGAFDEPSPERSYWLGFILADGCLISSRNDPAVAVGLSIGLQERDGGHLVAFNRFMRSNHPVNHHTVKSRQTGREYGACNVTMYSTTLVESLKRLGIEQRKSLRERVPPGFENDRDFWRGVIDGDGSVGVYLQKKGSRLRDVPVVHLVGSRWVCEGFARFVANQDGRREVAARMVKGRNHSQVSIQGHRAVPLLRMLYTKGCCALARKAAIAGEIASRDWPKRARGTCSVAGCGRPHYGHGYCVRHQSLHWAAAGGKPARRPCEVTGCEKPRTAHGFCPAHYRKWRLYGSPTARGRIGRPPRTVPA
ncbi:Uncharacterized protein OS=Clostridium celatum DSM 1785 GN=HMPREF0216_01614 PE=4 SV=1 [Gemmataceae bacterium]|nr:Uncharacterized protein OS=Clostridium celatum DSM 1785 GN=HMPREF0216_01614 PE=4 SV=1 [Gemmataceae bacterium]VTT96571.1 Uncharacterized protein OS=Clostridium celatum DSM 1785 GN=HMPREF0216_01614 PE=4 SV=1 [Gemmataceae bacterium]